MKNVKNDIKQKEWEIILYTTEDGKCYVNDFIKKLSEKR